MDLLSINGRKKLFGDINISGSKNASLPMMIASLLTEEQIILRKIPQLSDVQTLISILDSLGSKINITANSIKLKTKEIINHQAAYKLVKKNESKFLGSRTANCKNRICGSFPSWRMRNRNETNRYLFKNVKKNESEYFNRGWLCNSKNK